MAMAWAVVERAMKMQEVIVRALAGQLTWFAGGDAQREWRGGRRGGRARRRPDTGSEQHCRTACPEKRSSCESRHGDRLLGIAREREPPPTELRPLHAALSHTYVP